ncbi:hypothetical protein ASPWEDRAFT_63626 [Aspergillus wentii DTO 134E9]|uniref:Calcium-transporting ATPase n=1 Tax=Aspergillus wentii DTO 134E9 TaxID=1073089 RepID=A0A1L9RZD0_ASPWE|nr:uncharacterized protein ASPWEDRAFT_63626 [Aspergillus wentii DTO 134E9]OJJ40168.1 hypothetical protein ASPWEDRAFT_63626 [Aspergillus wentii DTO 134E9]
MDTSLSNLPYDDVPLSEALSPDPQHEHDFEVENNNFAFTPGQLNKLLNPKSLAAFQALGGPHGLAYGLRTDLTVGLSVDEGEIQDYVSLHAAQEMALSKSASWQPISFAGSGPVFISHGQSSTQFCDRIRVFGRNRLPEPRRKGFWRLLWDACNDKIIILLTIAAVISLSLGIYEAAVGQSKVDWIEGVSICVAVLIVVTVTAGNDWQKERQFGKLNKRKADRDVKAVRSGQPAMVHITDITVGDVLCIEPGDSPPADGILITGHGVKCDESTATGESDQIRKISSEEVWRRIVDGTATKDLDPFILSGSKVLEGVGTYLVTSVGRFSTHGRIMSSLQTENDPTPLQVKLGRLANWIGGLGTAAAVILFLVLFIRFLVQLSGNNESSAIKGQEFMDILIVAVTVIVVAIPEGLPLAVTLALAFATTRMVKENNLVRVLRACETMGNATVICSDKTGTLTQNQMTVVAGVFGDNIQFNNMEMAVEDKQCYQTITDTLTYFPAALKALAVKAIALNSTAFEEFKDGARQFVGDKTEVALLEFANDHLQMNFAEERPHSRVVHVFPFDSNQKCMGTVYYDHSIGYRLLVKGAAEIMLRSSTEIIAQQANQMLTRKHLDSDTREALTGKIDQYAGLSLRAIAMVYRDFPDWPPQALEKNEDSELRLDSLMADMVWIGAVGIHDPLRPEASAAIKICRTAGVQIKMVTGDNIKTASAIASSCGIKTPDGIIMEGPAFRKLPPEAIDTILPKLQVLARSSPDDKRILVDHLKHLGETVAVTGDGTNDGPALKSADVGFSMGISGTEVAKEASSIILLDDNFKSIVTAIAWGRAVNDAVSRFLQFQITVNITAVALTVITAIYSNSNESVLNAVQLLWVNLIMDTFAALALATDAPTAQILNRKPAPKSSPLSTRTMWKMIIGQSVYKLTVCLTLYFAGPRILNYDISNHHKQLELDTIIFNTFVWMQILNELNCRRLDNKFNILEGIHRNRWFMVINIIMVAGQITIIFVGGAAFGVTPLDGVQWAICIGCSVFCLPWAALMKLVPDEKFGVVFDFVVKSIVLFLYPIQRLYSSALHGIRQLSRAVFPHVSCFHFRRNSPASRDEHMEGTVERSGEDQV